MPVLMVCPWRDAADRAQWSLLRVVCPWIPDEEWKRLVMARRGPFVFRTRASMAAPRKGLMPSATAVEAIEIIPGTAGDAGFPESPPPPVPLPAVLREAVFTLGYESIEGLISIGDVEVEAIGGDTGSLQASSTAGNRSRKIDELTRCQFLHGFREFTAETVGKRHRVNSPVFLQQCRVVGPPWSDPVSDPVAQPRLRPRRTAL